MTAPALIPNDIQRGFDDPRWGRRSAPGAEAIPDSGVSHLHQAFASARSVGEILP